MICLRIPANNSTIFYVRVILEKFNMPKYAVAVGRKVGIYDTYDECKLQTVNYPNAKFKKFLTVKEAEVFIQQFSSKAKANDSSAVSDSINPMMQFRPENLHPPDLVKAEKISPKSDLFALTNRISSLEEKLSKFISDTTQKLESVVKRISILECQVVGSNECDAGEPARKKVKTDIPPPPGPLMTNDDGFVTVYTDGACSNNGKKGAQAGIGIWFNDDHPLNISAPVQGPATNNNAEIQAARMAIIQANRAGIRKLTIFTDSKFVINCITTWMNKWKKNEWKLVSGGDVKNKEELVKLDDAVQLLEAVEWTYVPGHAGVRGNEMADKLARQGASNYKANITYSRHAEISNVKFYDPFNEP